ncbi:MAG TPA: hypothetical protein VGC65_10590, partial [Bacteroidia bacterium]
MKRFILSLLVLLFVGISGKAGAQQTKVDSLYRVYSTATVDTTKINLLLALCEAYEMNRVKGLGFAREALELSERIRFNKGICIANQLIGDYQYSQLNYAAALKNYLKAAIAGENEKMYSELSSIYNGMGMIYSNQKKNDLSLKYFLKVAVNAEMQKNTKRI